MIDLFFIYLPYIISLLIGYMLINLILGLKNTTPFLLKFILGFGLGLGTSAHITFFSFIIYNRLNTTFIVFINLLVLLELMIVYHHKLKKNQMPLCKFPFIERKHLLSLCLLVFLSIPLWIHANMYPHGGWDAWSAWNLKARMLFLGGENWTNLFSPKLWRTSPHYPLLLPLMNVWGWTFTGIASSQGPLLISVTFGFLIGGLIYSGLLKLTKMLPAILALIIILTHQTFTKFAASQYSDIVVCYYLLASIICLLIARQENSKRFACLAGLCLGFLSFAKTEGLLSTYIITLLAVPYLLWSNPFADKKKILILFFIGLFIASIPSIIYYNFYAPDNITTINGLTSQEHPSTLLRLKNIFGFYSVELISPKWNGIWIALLCGILLGFKKCFRFNVLFIPVFLAIYTSIITAFYFVNTRWEILWWLSVSLSRVLFTLMPIIVFWIFYSLWQENA